MAHLHKIYDNDVHFKIDPNTRLFSNVGEVKSTISQGDHNSERITFEIPRTVDGHDMSLCDKVEIHYLNFNTSTRESVKDVYQVEDLQVSEEDENIVEFSWLLSGNSTKHNGDLSFSISFKCLSGEEIVYKWNTLIYSKITVGESYNYSQTVAQLYADVLEKWKLELIEAGTLTDEDISSAVNDYMGRNPISLSSLEQDEEHRLVTDSEKETWNSKSNFSGNYEDLTNKPTIPTKTSQLDNDSEFSTFSGSYNDLSDKPTIPSEYTLPIATPTTLGGVKPIAKTDEMTQEVGVDELGGLFTKEGGSGEWEVICEEEIETKISNFIINKDMNGNPFNLKKVFVSIHQVLGETETGFSGPLWVNFSCTESINNFGNSHDGSVCIGITEDKSNTQRKSEALIECDPTFGSILVNAMTSHNNSSMVDALVYQNSYTAVRGGRMDKLTEIKSICLGKDTSILVLGVGSKIKIYGVRK